MQHTVLARKWRPKKFEDLVGQQNTVKILTNIINNNRLHHAYLLTGTRGVGKTTIARIIAKALNCLNPQNGEPCTICENCIAIDGGSFVDVIEIDAASNTGVDNIREVIDNAYYTPSSGRYKVYIIDEVHMLSKSAFNAMLKTLEEPPAHVIFILATTDLQKVPATILSRCLQLKLRNLSINEISKYLSHVLDTESKKYESEALNLIATAANGSMRDALSILDQAIAFSNDSISSAIVSDMLSLTNDDMIYNLLDAISILNGNMLINAINILNDSGSDLENVLINLQQKLCNLNLAQLGAIKCPAELLKYFDTIGINDVQLYFEIASLGIEQIQKARDKYPIFVMTMLRMLAFNIGNNEQKIGIVTNGNYKPEHVIKLESINTSTTPPSNTLPKEEVAKVADQKTVVEEVIVEEVIENHNVKLEVEPINEVNVQVFNGEWFELIILLKEKLGVLYSFLENAQLISYTDSNFNLIVDERYQSALNQKLMGQLEQILSEHFSQKINVKIEFQATVSNTLKEKKILDTELKQQLAEHAINEDNYLVEVCSAISAKIVPGSIKPI